MHKHFIRICCSVGLWVTGIILSTALVPLSVGATNNVPVVISQIQVREAPVGESSNTYNEFIEIANNSAAPVDITGWCLKYASANSPENDNLLGCFTPTAANGYVLLPINGRAFAASTQYLTTHGQTKDYDFSFEHKLADGAGYVKLYDGNGTTATEIDRVAWGTGNDSVNAGKTIGSLVMQRIILESGLLKQTGRLVDDFILGPAAETYKSSAQYVFDLCLNIASIQTEVPPDLSSDGEGNCSPPSVDVCLNIDGVQSALPQGDTVDEAGNCYPVDDDPGSDQPPDDDGNDVPTDPTPVDQAPILPLELSEILPNPSGTDKGHEFIEIYNPNAETVDLADYQLFVGANLVVNFTDQTIAGDGYLILMNSDYDFTLANTTGLVSLLLHGEIVDQTSYSSPKDSWSWAKVGGVWQYTNQVTPGLTNVISVITSSGTNSTANGLQPCAEGQYRNPETNRCKSLATATSTLTPCSADEERNPDTNRCRKIAAATTEPSPCKEGQERNPDTNRCRNIQAMTTADYGVEGAKTEKAAGSKLIWWLIVGVLVFGLVYAAFEWYPEIIKLWRKLRSWRWRRK